MALLLKQQNNFFEIVSKRYDNNFEAAIAAFIKLHGKK